MRTALIFPTYNAAGTVGLLLNSIEQQTIKPDNILAIDCTSSDTTIEILKAHNVAYHTIETLAFNHGATRKYATSLLDADIYIFVTQDVRLANKHALENIINAFTDEKVGCAYGRQLPNQNAKFLAAHLRLFAYPPTSLIKSYEDRKHLGIRTCTCSDNFAAYRKTALFGVGGFPENTILAEDMYVAAKMLIQDWKVAYRADAMIYHSHNYTIIQEVKLFFDTGAFHAMNPWIMQTFHGHISDGIKYLQSAITYCVDNHAYFALIRVPISVFAKYFGFLLGKHYKLVPGFIRKKISMFNYYWT